MCCAIHQLHAQNPADFLIAPTYIGGYHIKCYGQSTGTINANPSFGTAPYTFLWNTNETTAQISNKPAGVYIVTATDSLNVSNSDTLTLTQPNNLSYQSTLSNYYGFNIEKHGHNNGSIQLAGNGGTPPYTYLWNNNDNNASRTDLTSGYYSFIITDANQCSTNGNITLTEPYPVQFSFTNVQNAQCSDGADGAATLNISGGLGDFSVVWSNGSFSLSPNDLLAGYNEVRIMERGRAIIDTGIIINSPAKLEIDLTLSQYANGYHVSCVDCYNGSITTTVIGGTAPYTYLWDDENGSTTANLSNLNGGKYMVNIIDAHGCEIDNGAVLRMPIAKDWSRQGNANIDPSEFIGSTDTSAVVFKTNSQEAMRLMGNGKVGVGINNPTEKLEVNGMIKAQGFKLNNLSFKIEPATTQLPERIFFGATDNEISSFSSNSLNQFLCLNPTTSARLNVFSEAILFKSQVCTPTLNPAFFLGIRGCDAVVELMKDGATTTGGPTWGSNKLLLNTLCGKDVVVGHVDGGNLVVNHNLGIGIINPTERLHVEGNTLLNGNVRIGNDNSTINDTKLAVEGIIYAREMKVTQGIIWPDYVFKKSYQLPTLKETEKFISENGHLPEIPSAEEIENKGLSLADMLTLQMKKIEELTLHLIEQQKEIEALKQNLKK